MEFRNLALPLLKQDIFPKDLVNAIHGYMNNPAASSCSDIELTRTLSKYDKRDVPLENA